MNYFLAFKFLASNEQLENRNTTSLGRLGGNAVYGYELLYALSCASAIDVPMMLSKIAWVSIQEQKCGY